MLAVTLFLAALATPAKAAPAPLVPFDATVVRLPSTFAAHSFTAVVARYRKATVPAKGEFETTAAYEQRVREAASASYAFRLPIEVEYDADRERLRCGLPVDKNREERGTSLMVWVPDATTTPVGSRVGENAFGVKVSIRTIKLRESGLRTPLTKIERDGNTAYLDLSFTPDEARAAKANLAVLLVCTVAPDDNGAYVVDGTDYAEPTVDDPLEIHYSFTYLNCGEASLWAYDSKTGAVHRKVALVVRGSAH